ncbi:MAG TPA: hypothetical protein DD732_02915 [Rhizobiales bacterium]|jgi:hypothetical protein|nr:hypothetical protein [Hyphomicrobiales bacterium]
MNALERFLRTTTDGVRHIGMLAKSTVGKDASYDLGMILQNIKAKKLYYGSSPMEAIQDMNVHHKANLLDLRGDHELARDRRAEYKAWRLKKIADQEK